MKLYKAVGSPNCRKVEAALRHLDLPVDIEYVDFFSGEMKRPGFLQLNPNGMVPVLKDGDFVLWESNAIMQYLAERAGDRQLFPSDPRKRADVVRWQCWELTHYNKALGTLVWESIVKPNYLDAKPDEAVAAWATEHLKRFAPALDAHLVERRYLVGDALTIADYSVAHLEMFKEEVPFDWSAYPHLNAYYGRMRADPHWAATAPSAGQAVGRRPVEAAEPVF